MRDATRTPSLSLAMALVVIAAAACGDDDGNNEQMTIAGEGSDPVLDIPGEQPFLFLAINIGDVITHSVLWALPEGGGIVLPAATIEALEARDEIGPNGGPRSWARA